MGRVLHRPAPFAVPAPVLRAALGEMAGDVLGSARVLPARLLESGFRFAFPEIDGAIRAALSAAPGDVYRPRTHQRAGRFTTTSRPHGARIATSWRPCPTRLRPLCDRVLPPHDSR
ncbi:hypothetical protein STENM327S_01346 [Streptomyces tendae]